ncbi:hypothetical protein EON65_28645 [archaeon]|nr:MAG: hypothetical protein EON65_28645 [archaeon]
MHTNKVRELCLRGIPPTVRAKVWPILVGNELEVGGDSGVWCMMYSKRLFMVLRCVWCEWCVDNGAWCTYGVWRGAWCDVCNVYDHVAYFCA